MEIRPFYDEYLATFVALCRGDHDDPEALLGYYSVPLLLSADRTAWLRTGDEVVDVVRAQAADMRAAGFDRSEMSDPRTVALNPTTAWFGARFVRRRTDGSAIAEFSAFYLISDLPEGRRITTLGLEL
ncbi:hypothetical protein WCD74_02505 [Actinomycetospora sp. OC33-EN08]|uniref:DUF6841 domain-containing protein n=1 Tax=Actinomycetospora aurantiaca TaxID=3129233 RepID=A0ABU8MH38_9PSEU